ncbi:hypothetical protein [Streptomyces sp. NBC_00687]|uniref:hypothetical protein n=1 Tax=Streptomyces sp. NBC_00687 TaxID=2975807 RepID=UPI00225420DA|nr:hypothetical protein [Streptomyces sp. NBC_00687]MCX4919079.1 hypothetical protein [Streptomyces sp. NBC_00687]
MGAQHYGAEGENGDRIDGPSEDALSGNAARRSMQRREVNATRPLSTESSAR